jgi:diaminopimelate decarboxylase
VVWEDGGGGGGVGARLLTEESALLRQIAADVGTPVYVYDAQVIRDQYAALESAFESVPHRVFYSVKANSNLAILDLMRGLGAGADIVSVGELERAIRVGYDTSHIVFNGVGKSADDLTRAIERCIGIINVESFAELRLLRDLARQTQRRAAVGIRVNPAVSAVTHPYTRTGAEGMKFGVPRDEVSEMVRWILAAPELELVSVGMHIGSQILDAAHYREGARTLAEVVSDVRAAGCDTLRTVDVGGGIGIRYTSEDPLTPEAFAAAVGPLAGETDLQLGIEPGRYLVGASGVLLTTCLYRKSMGTKDFAIVDAGMNDLLRPSLYDAVHEIVVIDGSGDDESVAVVDVVGPVCESGDFLGLHRRLAGAVPGALLAVSGAGAYGFTMASSYNSRPRPPEVLVDGERWAVIRERETVDDLLRGERTLADVEAVGGWRR